MSTIWTPSGEYEPKPAADEPSTAPPPPGPGGGREPTPEEIAASIKATLDRPMPDHLVFLIDQLMQLVELHLNRRALTGGAEAPDMAAASLGIDAVAALVDGLGPRLGRYHEPLVKTVEEMKMAFLEVSRDQEQP